MIEKIDFSQSEQYTLSIRLSTDGFSFSIYNPLNGSDFFFHPYPVNTQRSMAANAKAFLAETEELKRPFKQVNILIHSERYTVLPFELYEDEQMESLFYGCQLCVNACPHHAITFDQQFEHAVFDRSKLVMKLNREGSKLSEEPKKQA